MIEKAEYANELSEKIVHYRDIQAKLLEDLPYIPLWYEDHVVVLNDSIEGYSVGLDGNYDALENTRRKTLDGARPNE